MIEVKYFSDVLTKLSRNLGQLICLLCIGYIWIQSLNQFVGIYHEICRFIVTSLLTLYEKRLIGAVHNLRRQDFLIYDPLCRRFDFQACSLKNGKKISEKLSSSICLRSLCMVFSKEWSAYLMFQKWVKTDNRIIIMN